MFTKSAKMGHFSHFAIIETADNEVIIPYGCLASGGGVNT